MHFCTFFLLFHAVGKAGVKACQAKRKRICVGMLLLTGMFLLTPGLLIYMGPPRLSAEGQGHTLLYMNQDEGHSHVKAIASRII